MSVSVVEVAGREALRPFEIAEHVFETRMRETKEGRSYWSVPIVPGLIAENVVAGRPWWRGFADFVSKEEQRRRVFSADEKGGLWAMVQNEEVFPGERAERIFVEACHEAWQRRMGQLGERSRREGTGFSDLVGREFEKLRISFSRCKNAAAIRAAVTDFWSRGGGSLTSLQGRWPLVLELFDERNWQKARDLALLALASYASPEGDRGDRKDLTMGAGGALGVVPENSLGGDGEEAGAMAKGGKAPERVAKGSEDRDFVNGKDRE
ncbi:MAG: CRISPR-associated protein Cas8a1/Csx13 [Deltaproteobacteria bacterium]|nr:MAG: CRISPR-associated protein Cas8a1/Csx13 [Deltaproteobacteria bacterium]